MYNTDDLRLGSDFGKINNIDITKEDLNKIIKEDIKDRIIQTTIKALIARLIARQLKIEPDNHTEQLDEVASMLNNYYLRRPGTHYADKIVENIQAESALQELFEIDQELGLL